MPIALSNLKGQIDTKRKNNAEKIDFPFLCFGCPYHFGLHMAGIGSKTPRSPKNFRLSDEVGTILLARTILEGNCLSKRMV